MRMRQPAGHVPRLAGRWKEACDQSEFRPWAWVKGWQCRAMATGWQRNLPGLNIKIDGVAQPWAHTWPVSAYL